MKFSKTKPVSFEEETMQTFEPLNNVKSIENNLNSRFNIGLSI